MAGFQGSGSKGNTSGQNVAFGVPGRKVRVNKVSSTPTYVNSGRKGSGTSGGTGGKKAK